MASESKLMKKIEAANAKLREVRSGARDKLAVTAKVAPAMPIAGGVATYITGYGDAMAGTPENKNPITLGATAVAWIGSIAAAFWGHPTAGVAAASVATAGVGALTHDRGYEKGLAARAKG